MCCGTADPRAASLTEEVAAATFGKLNAYKNSEHIANLKRKLGEWYREAPNGASPGARTGDEEDEGGPQNPSAVAATGTAFPAVGTGDSSDRLAMD
jgi:hypothetical protein